MSDDDVLQAALRLLARAVDATREHRAQLVLAGGLVPALLRHHPSATPQARPALATSEADVVAIPPIAITTQRGLHDGLLRRDFVVHEALGFGAARGPDYYQDRAHGPDRLAPNYIEFLSPIRGKETSGLPIVGGLRTQALRYLDLLDHRAWELDLHDVPGLDVPVGCIVRLPHPAMFILQKVLARGSGRFADKQSKDLAAIYDVALLARTVWPEFREVIDGAAATRAEWGAWLTRGELQLRALFVTVTSEGPIEAGRIFRAAFGARAPTEVEIHGTMTRFLAAALP